MMGRVGVHSNVLQTAAWVWFVGRSEKRWGGKKGKIHGSVSVVHVGVNESLKWKEN